MIDESNTEDMKGRILFMAGTIMHLVIADRLLDRLNIENPALFYCGNLAPDAIMARENYVRDMKTHTHFKDGLKNYEFRIKSNQEAYRKKLLDFAKFFLKRDDPHYELYLGYIVHILVDELYLLEYYEEFLVELEKKNIPPTDETFGRAFVADVDRVDWELVRSYQFRYPMPEILLSISGYEIPGWITASEIEESKNFIINKNFICTHEKEALEVTTYEKNKEFMDICVSRIPEMLAFKAP